MHGTKNTLINILNNMSKKKIFFFLIIFFPTTFIIIFNILGGYFFHDTLDFYRLYKYVFILSQNDGYPLFTSKLDQGLNASFLYFWIGNLGIAIIKLSQIIKINSYLSYNIYITLNLIIFFYGIYLNLKKSSNGELKLILFSSLFFGSTLIYRQLAWDLLAYLVIPYVMYWSLKFARTGDFKNINKICAAILINYILFSSYISIYTAYISLIIILVNFFIINYSLTKIIKKIYCIRIKQILILALIGFIIYYIKIYQGSIIHDNYIITSPLRLENGIVPYDVFSSYANYSILNLLHRTLVLKVSLFDFQFFINPFFILCLIILFLKRKIIFNKILKNYFIIGSIIFLIFFLNFEIINKFLYNLPLMKYTRHLNIALVLAKPLLFLFVAILIIDNLNFKRNNQNYFNIINKVNFLKIKKIYIFYFICACFYLPNFYQIYNLKQLDDDKIYADFYKRDLYKNVNNKNKCLEKYDEKYKILNFPTKTEWNYVGATIYLITEDVPCTNVRRQEYKNKFLKLKSDNLNFIDHDIMNNVFKIESTNLSNEDLNLLRLSYSEKWEFIDKDLKEKIKIENHNGFLSLKLKASLNKDIVYLKYEDKKLLNYIYFLNLSGFLIITLFAYLLIRLYIKKK